MNGAPSRPRRPTLADVAQVAGVSLATVSRVLNGGKWVSAGALEAVNSAIASTGYSANRVARSLKTGRANLVAFLLTEPDHLNFQDPTITKLLRAAAQELARRDVPMSLMVAGSAEEKLRVAKYLGEGHVDGVLMTSRHAGSSLVADLMRNGVPVVAAGVPLGHEAGVSYVAADDRGGAVEMVRHLVARGCRTIATIAGPASSSGGALRLDGYRLAMGPAFEPSLVVEGDFSRESGARSMELLMERRPDLDGVFVASDLMAAGALSVLDARGRRVPADVAVAGFDDSGLAEALLPPLTTMRQPIERIATEMVRLLFALLEGEGTAAVTLPVTLVERQSTARRAASSDE